MAASPAPSPLIVPPEIVTELRKALLKDLKDVSSAITDLVQEPNLQRRASRYRELAVRFVIRQQLQEAAGWPDDPPPDTQLMIRGHESHALVIECLTAHRDAHHAVRAFEDMSEKDPPERRGSVEWPQRSEHQQMPDRLLALENFLAANAPQASGSAPG
jgi:hypothetical protein